MVIVVAIADVVVVVVAVVVVAIADVVVAVVDVVVVYPFRSSSVSCQLPTERAAWCSG